MTSQKKVKEKSDSVNRRFTSRKRDVSDFSVVLDAFGILGKWLVQFFVVIGRALYKVGLAFWNWIDKMDEPKKKRRK